MATALTIAPSIGAAERTTVAYIGDQGTGSSARAVLQLALSEGVDLIVLQGDLGYGESPSTWGRMMDEELGETFPVLSVAGNHDRHEWPEYQRWLERRVDAVSGLRCDGDVGVKARCTFGPLSIVQTAPGVKNVSDAGPDDDYAGFIERSFTDDDSTWKLCSFHKNQRDMQTGEKGDSTGWAVYEACREAGAMIVTGHEHAYSRTHLLDNFEARHVVARGDDLRLEPGRSIAVVSGLGGKEARPQTRGGDWWASIYTASQGATRGALICTYEGSAADCRFKAINGAVPDRFRLTTSAVAAEVLRNDGVESSGTSNAIASGVPFVFSRTDKSELRWIARTADGRIGSIHIGADCAQRLGGATGSGNWRELMSIAPAFDEIGNPCIAPASRALTDNAGVDAGFVFSRTDKDEHRWVAPSDSGVLGSIWISDACFDSLGVSGRSGDWRDLMALAPAFDAIDSPCARK